MGDPFAILRILADGCFHSGAAIALAVDSSPTDVRRHLGALHRYGLTVRAVPGRGYRLTHPIESLDRDRIVAKLTPTARGLLTRLDVCPQIDSTNRVLMDRWTTPPGAHGHVCLAEFQTAGRGRRGRRWINPWGSGICMALGWNFEAPPHSLAALSLAAGVAIMRAFGRLAITGVGLKWPNDVMWGQRKLGGVLVEMRAGPGGPCGVVIGIGINVALHHSQAAAIEQPWTDLATVCGRVPSRNELAALLVGELFDMTYRYGQGEAAAFIDEWRCYDVVRGERVRLSWPGGQALGQAHGVDSNGALLLAVNGTIERYLSGDLSLRIAS